MPSYEKINYLLRPNKSVERKMICEMLSRISAIKVLSRYQYIGFGSTYFADFSLFHRNLGINQMISIEGEERAQDRCEFNKPFACIDLKMGKSSAVLPNIDINNKDSIIWLDYDGTISDEIFSDINTVMTLMRPDSFFMLSLNAELYKPKSGDKEESKQNLIRTIGEERFPKKYIDRPLTSPVYLEILYQCIIEEIRKTIQTRKGLDERELTFHQTIYFVYKDGAKMMTIGGFLFDTAKEDDYLSRMSVPQLPFYNNTSTPFNIHCPVLSIKEMQALNAYLPCEIKEENGRMTDERLNNFPIENEDIINYSSLYRYYPNFTETLI